MTQYNLFFLDAMYLFYQTSFTISSSSLSYLSPVPPNLFRSVTPWVWCICSLFILVNIATIMIMLEIWSDGMMKVLNIHNLHLYVHAYNAFNNNNNWSDWKLWQTDWPIGQQTDRQTREREQVSMRKKFLELYFTCTYIYIVHKCIFWEETSCRLNMTQSLWSNRFCSVPKCSNRPGDQNLVKS